MRPMGHSRLSRRSLLRALPIAAVAAGLAAALHAAPPAATPPDVAPPAPSAPVEPAFVILTTNKGEIVLELNAEKAPISVANFLKYVEEGFYNGLIFHRVIPNFMIQGGGFGPNMVPKMPGAPIKNEWENGLKNDRGTISMARLSAPDSASSQFFINVKDNPALNGSPERKIPGYAVFGKVIAGMDVVDAIRDVATAPKPPHEAVPVEPVIIEKAVKITAEDAAARAAAPAKVAPEAPATPEKPAAPAAPEKPAAK